MQQETRSEKLSSKTAATPHEGSLTKTIEHQTAKVPSLFYLILAGASIAASVGLITTKREKWANFVGLWVPSFMLIGIYNKLVKLEGSDRFDKEALH